MGEKKFLGSRHLYKWTHRGASKIGGEKKNRTVNSTTAGSYRRNIDPSKTSSPRVVSGSTHSNTDQRDIDYVRNIAHILQGIQALKKPADTGTIIDPKAIKVPERNLVEAYNIAKNYRGREKTVPYNAEILKHAIMAKIAYEKDPNEAIKIYSGGGVKVGEQNISEQDLSEYLISMEKNKLSKKELREIINSGSELASKINGNSSQRNREDLKRELEGKKQWTRADVNSYMTLNDLKR